MKWTETRLLGALVVLGATLTSGPAHAGKKECANAYVEAQKLKKDGALKKAREQLIICGKDECMSAVKKDCIAWLDEVNASLPTVVVEAKGPDGKETFDVKVTVDGQVISEKLDVKAIELDPGTHKFVFEYAGQEPIEQEVVLREGQKNKTLEVSFAKEQPAKQAAPTPEPEAGPVTEKPKPSKKVPVASYVLGGVGLVGLAGAGFFWLGAQGKQSDLDKSKCAPNCAQSDVDTIKKDRLIGDVSLGVGLACIGTAAYLWLKPRKTEAAQETAAHLDVRVSSQGGYAGVFGRF